MNTLRAETKTLIPPIPRSCSLVRSITIATLQHCRLPCATTTPTRKETRDKSGKTLLGSLPSVAFPLLSQHLHRVRRGGLAGPRAYALERNGVRAHSSGGTGRRSAPRARVLRRGVGGGVGQRRGRRRTPEPSFA